MGKAVWEVYRHNFNSDIIEKYNVLSHGTFIKYAQEHKKKNKTKEEFADNLRKELMYYFWSKCEHEVILDKQGDKYYIKPWAERKQGISLDVTDDEFDWASFYDWVNYLKYSKDGEIKIDVYDQVMYKFKDFVDYCWEAV